MNDIDEKIREALADSDESKELLVDQGFWGEYITPFKGKRRWVNAVGLVYGVLCLAVAVWGGYRFFGATTVHDQILWAGVCLLSILINAFMKVSFWMEAHTNRILREVKRVELLLVQKQENE